MDMIMMLPWAGPREDHDHVQVQLDDSDSDTDAFKFTATCEPEPEARPQAATAGPRGSGTVRRTRQGSQWGRDWESSARTEPAAPVRPLAVFPGRLRVGVEAAPRHEPVASRCQPQSASGRDPRTGPGPRTLHCTRTPESTRNPSPRQHTVTVTAEAGISVCHQFRKGNGVIIMASLVQVQQFKLGPGVAVPREVLCQWKLIRNSKVVSCIWFHSLPVNLPVPVRAQPGPLPASSSSSRPKLEAWALCSLAGSLFRSLRRSRSLPLSLPPSPSMSQGTRPARHNAHFQYSSNSFQTTEKSMLWQPHTMSARASCCSKRTAS
eukprot:2661677-Rhodomonas_salina.1